MTGPDLVELWRWRVDGPASDFRYQIWMLAKALGAVNWPPVVTVVGSEIILSVPCKPVVAPK